MIKSYAKINLTLDILGKRPDGYHQLETIFQQIDLHDQITLEDIPQGIEIICNIKELQSPNNLAFKAAQLLLEHCQIQKGIRIHLHKQIPIAAGLSGGSSNAAAVLSGLNKRWDLNLSQETLFFIGSKIGMDVPFHIVGGTCLGTGRGEIIKELPKLSKHFLLLVKPEFGVLTKEAFAGLNYNEIGKRKSTDLFCKDYNLNHLHNDFEAGLFKKFPALPQLKSDLEGGILSGSGSCFFKLSTDRSYLNKVYQTIVAKYPYSYLGETK